MKGHKRFASISNLDRKRRLYRRIAQLAQAQMIAEQNRLQQGAEQHRRAKEMREIFSPHRRKF